MPQLRYQLGSWDLLVVNRHARPDNAPFWTNVSFFSTVHSRSSARCGDGLCECHEAMLWDDSEEPRPTHNLDKVETFLGRSKGALVAMDVRTYPVFAEHSLATQLAEIVRPHAHRISALTYIYGDLAFFVKFAQHIRKFQSLGLLRMRQSFSAQGVQDTWPLAEMQLEHLQVPRLREFRGYGDFWWDIPRPPEARALAALEHLRCNFSDARSFYHCLRSCPNLVFLNAELNDYPATRLPPTPPDDAAELVPRLRDLILDRMTPLWEAVVLPIIRRPALRILTLRYNSFDADTVFHSLCHLADDVQLSILFITGSVDLEATDSHGRSYWLRFNGVAAVWRMWNKTHLRFATVAISELHY